MATVRSTLTEQERKEVANQLQPELIELIDLALVGKQLHWNVVGEQFRTLHLQLDELVDAWRLWGDEVAERLTAIGVPADGRPRYVAESTPFESVSEGWMKDVDVIRVLSDRIETVARNTRERMKVVGDIDPASEDVLIETLHGLEEQLWMVSAQAE